PDLVRDRRAGRVVAVVQLQAEPPERAVGRRTGEAEAAERDVVDGRPALVVDVVVRRVAAPAGLGREGGRARRPAAGAADEGALVAGPRRLGPAQLGVEAAAPGAQAGRAAVEVEQERRRVVAGQVGAGRALAGLVPEPPVEGAQVDVQLAR